MVDDADALTASWSANADLWTRAVRGGQIASRREVTDAAILGAVRRGPTRKILDVGCGEGWLCRALAGAGAEIVGVDVSPELIARAREENDDATFHCLDYAALAVEPARAGSGFDTIVCNFSLLDDLAGPLLAGLARIAAPDARLFIQTVHPLAAGPPYFDGWRTEHFAGFGDGGWTAMPWFFRTFGTWVALLSASWVVGAIEEPRATAAALPASLLLEARAQSPRMSRIARSSWSI